MADLELRNIVKSFGEHPVLEDISLHVADGGFTILLGPSGCGKSTLLRIIAGLERQTAGEVFIGGQPVGQCSPQERDIAMVFQTYALYPHLSVRQNLAFGLKMRGEPRATIDARIQEAADLLGITDLLDRRPRELSGGQRQRVAMGRAIVRKPKLFLFDEPLSNLDARLRTTMRVELKKLHRRLGATMIYVTHDQVEAMTLGDTIVLLNRGRIRQIDPPARIYAAPADPFVAGFIGSPGMNLLEGTVTHKASQWAFTAGAVSLTLPPVRSPIPIEGVSRTVLGIRPEDIRLEPSGETDSTLTGRLEVVEDLGADRLFHVQAGDHRLVARPSSPRDLAPDTDLTLYLPHAHLHLFVDDRRADWQ